MKTQIYKISILLAFIGFYANLLAQNKVLTTNFGHADCVNCVVFSPNGKILASASNDETIKLWDVKSGREIRTLNEHTNYVNSVSFSPNGKILASSSDDETIKLWNVETGHEIKTLEGHKYSVNSVSFSPNGKILASGSWDNTIKLWDIKNMKKIRTLKGHKYDVNSVSFNPKNGKILASGSDDETIKFWHIEKRRALRTLEGHKYSVNSVSFSPNGKILASGSGDNTIKLWNVETGQKLKTLDRHTNLVNSISFSPNGKILASGSWDSTIKLWDIETMQEIRTLKGHNGYVNSVSFSPNGKILASGSRDSTTKLWEVKTGKLLATLVGMNKENNYDWVIYTPQGKYDGVNCSKYLHYVENNKTYNLPANDPNYEKDLLVKIFNKYNSDDIEPVKPVVVDNTKLQPRISIKDKTPPNIVFNHSEYVTAENKTFTISGKATDKSGVLLVLVNNVKSDDGQGNLKYTANLKEGENRFQILAIDNATNRTIKNITINYAPKRKDIALLFYVSEYSDSKLPSLKGTRKNAEKLGKVLKNNYGFETYIFPNYTSNQIREKLEEYQKKTYSENDQLLIYFSGHGSNRFSGMLLCANNTDIPHSNFKELSEGNCKHTILVVDACFSGLLTSMLDAAPPPYKTTKEEYVEELFKTKPTLKALTSGEGEATIKNDGLSIFTEALIDVLQNAEGEHHNILTLRELSDKLGDKYKDLKAGKFSKSDNSDARFLFMKKQ